MAQSSDPTRSTEFKSPVAPGDLLAGKYRIERVLGVGGMGVVVAARHEQLGQLVALKFVLASSDAGAIERFVREARAAVRLKSEHVARVLDVGTLDTGAPYIVMEHLEGADLSTVLDERGPLAVETAVDYVLQACEALSEAHGLGIIHRDLKPANLFLTQSVDGGPLVKVLDFGISKTLNDSQVGALTKTNSAIGSPLYMAPEQMRSARSVDARSDIWALGVVLYELLVGATPFQGTSVPEVCLKAVSEPPPAIVRPDVPVGLTSVVERCLSKDPAGRFESVVELAAALAPFAPPGSSSAASCQRIALESRGKRDRNAETVETSLPTATAAMPLAKTTPRPQVTTEGWIRPPAPLASPPKAARSSLLPIFLVAAAVLTFILGGAYLFLRPAPGADLPGLNVAPAGAVTNAAAQNTTSFTGEIPKEPPPLQEPPVAAPAAERPPQPAPSVVGIGREPAQKAPILTPELVPGPRLAPNASAASARPSATAPVRVDRMDDDIPAVR